MRFNNLKETITLYLSYIKLILENIFKETFINIIYIFKDFKKIIIFIILLPFVYYLIKLQIIIGFLFFIFYNFLKTEYEIKCKEIHINFLHPYRYTILNNLFLVPKAKAYIIVYNILYIWWNKNYKYNLKNILIVIIIFLFIYLIKFSVILLIGYTFLSIKIVSNIIVKLFDILSWNFETKKACLQHICINFFLDNVDSVGKAEDMNIIINNNNVNFNMKQLISSFLLKVNKPDLFLKSYNLNNIQIKHKIINNHYTFFYKFWYL